MYFLLLSVFIIFVMLLCTNNQLSYLLSIFKSHYIMKPHKDPFFFSWQLEFLWESETIWFDEDGSLSGTAGASVVPWMALLPTDSCTTAPELSVNAEVGDECACVLFFSFLRSLFLAKCISQSTEVKIVLYPFENE